MFLEVDEAEFRADPDAMLDRIQSGCEAVVIKADGKIVAALVNACLFEQVRRMGDRFGERRSNIDTPASLGRLEWNLRNGNRDPRI